MKTALSTIALTVVFFGVGVFVLQKMNAPASADGEASADSTATERAAAPVEAAEVAALTAELADVQMRLAEAEARADSLHQLVGDRRAQADANEAASQEEIAALAGTLTKLEGEALSDVVQRLDGTSFVQLYEATSSRNRARLLDALTPTQAAAFVRHQLPGGAARARRTTTPVSDRDSTATPS